MKTKISIDTSLIFIIFTFSLALLSLFRLRTFPYWADAPEFSLITKQGGVPHAPGYPTFLFGLLIFRSILPYLPAVEIASLYTILTTSLSVTVLFYFLRSWLIPKLHALIGSLTFLSMPLIFFHSIVPEVFMMHLSLCLIALIIMRKIIETQKSSYAHYLGLVFGLGIGNHHTIIFLLPSFCYMFFPVIKKTNVKQGLIIFFITGIWTVFTTLALYYSLTLYWHNNHTFLTTMYWGDLSNLSGILSFFLRADYGTFQQHPSGSKISWDNHFAPTFLEILRQFGPYGFFLLFISTIFSRISKFLILELLFLAVSLVFVFFSVNIPYSMGEDLHLIQRFLIAPVTILFILSIQGIENVRVSKKYKKLLPCLLLIPLTQNIFLDAQEYLKIKSKNFEKIIQAQLRLVNKETIFITESEAVGSALLYYAKLSIYPIYVIYNGLCETPWYIEKINQTSVIAQCQLPDTCVQKWNSWPQNCKSHLFIAKDLLTHLKEPLQKKLKQYGLSQGLFFQYDEHKYHTASSITLPEEARLGAETQPYITHLLRTYVRENL